MAHRFTPADFFLCYAANSQGATEGNMERAVEILSVFFVSLGVAWFLLAQGSGIVQGIREARGRKQNRPRRG